MKPRTSGIIQILVGCSLIGISISQDQMALNDKIQIGMGLAFVGLGIFAILKKKQL